MANQRAPGVYFNESANRVQAIPVGTGVVGFMGQASRGLTDRTQLIRSWGDYQRLYGGLSNADDLAPRVFNFFDEGGIALMLARLVGDGAAGAANTADFKDHADTVTASIAANSEGVWGNTIGITTLLYEKSVSGKVTSADRNLVALSAATYRAQLDSLTEIRLGDSLDVINTTTGALVAGPVAVVGFDAANNDVYLYDTTGGITFPVTTTLRCASRHRGKATLTAPVANGAAYADVSNTDGIEIGSTVLLSLYSHKPTVSANSYSETVAAVVSRVVGKRVYFSQSPVLTDPMAASKYAELKLTDGGANSLTFTSVLPGGDGNTISITLANGAVDAVAVVGRDITFTAAAATDLDAAVLAIAADPIAAGLVVVVAGGVGATRVSTVVAVEPTGDLEGGALAHVITQEFKLSVLEDGAVVEEHDYLSLNPNSNNYVGIRLGGTTSPLSPSQTNESIYIIMYGMDGAEGAGQAELVELPQAITSIALAGGLDGSDLYDDDLIGASNPRTGMYLFDGDDEMDALGAPGFTGATFQRALVAYCENRGRLVALLDVPNIYDSAMAVQTYREVTLGSDSSYGQVFWPRTEILDRRPNAARGGRMWMDASASCAGIISSTLSRRGPHYSAGNNRPVTALRLEYPCSREDHGSLNDAGVSVLRVISNRGIRLFGDRTLLRTGDERKFGNVRRWLNFFKRSMEAALADLAFEPANEDIFFIITGVVDAFLSDQWNRGALYPKNNRSQAYYVKCDSQTTTADDLRDGQVNCEVGVSPVTPMERLVFSLQVSSGGITVSEV